MATVDKNDKSKRLICLCNTISQQQIEDAIARGCTTLGKIFDATTAGVGACGGSCQPILRQMLEGQTPRPKATRPTSRPSRKK